MKKLYLLCTMLLIFSCGGKNKDIVISRIDDISSKPSWVKESKPFYIEKGEVFVLGQATIPAANANINAGYRVAEMNAKALIASSISQRLDYVFQNAEEGLTINSNQAKFVGAEASKLTINAMKVNKRYWEKVSSVIDANGNRDLKLNIYSLISMPEADFKQAILDAINKGKNKGISEDFKKQVDAHWDNFVNEGKETK